MIEVISEQLEARPRPARTRQSPACDLLKSEGTKGPFGRGPKTMWSKT